jgi:hypothetical protein
MLNFNNMKTFQILLVTMLISFLNNTLSGATGMLDIGIFNNPVGSNKLEVRVKPNSTITAGIYTGGTFVIKYPSSYAVDLSVFSTSFGYILAAQAVDPMSSYKYYAFTSAGGTYPAPWSVGTGYPIAVIAHTNNGSGNGTFELADGTDPFAAALIGDPVDVFYQELSNNGGPAQNETGNIYAPSTVAALPVELTKFSANPKPNRTVLLNWETAAEINLSHYEIEYSTDGNNFHLIGKTDAAAAQNHGANYDYLHQKPIDGDNFYRLRMVDRNGAFEYSPIRVVRFEDKSGGFSILPNPSSGPFSLISLKLEQFDTKISIEVFDQTGKLLLDQPITDEKTDFDLSEFPASTYHLRVRTNHEILKQFQLVTIKN